MHPAFALPDHSQTISSHSQPANHLSTPFRFGTSRAKPQKRGQEPAKSCRKVREFSLFLVTRLHGSPSSIQAVEGVWWLTMEGLAGDASGTYFWSSAPSTFHFLERVKFFVVTSDGAVSLLIFVFRCLRNVLSDSFYTWSHPLEIMKYPPITFAFSTFLLAISLPLTTLATSADGRPRLLPFLSSNQTTDRPPASFFVHCANITSTTIANATFQAYHRVYPEVTWQNINGVQGQHFRDAFMKCPNICLLPIGQGNSDLSGIGVRMPSESGSRVID